MKKTKTRGQLSKYRWAIISASGLIVGASVATGAYFIYDSYTNKDIEYGKPVSIKVFNEINMDMHETNVGADKEKRTYFFSKNGLEKFKERIQDSLDVGPEFFDLHKIIIDDKNTISSDANGNYMPQYDLINLNSEEFIKEGLPPVKINEIENKEILDVKIELMFQVFFHEYGHFLANKYLNGYSDRTNGDVEGWNKDFEEGFEKALHYSDNNANPMIAKDTSSYWQSMGSIYSAADIYNRINKNTGDNKFPEMSKSSDSFPIWAGTDPFFRTGENMRVHIDTQDNKYHVFDLVKNSLGQSGLVPTSVPSLKGKSWLSQIDAERSVKDAQSDIKEKTMAKWDKFKYLWSLDELFTRKYEQILYNPVSIGDPNNDKNVIKNGFHYYLGKDGVVTNNITTWSFDRSLYMDLSSDKPAPSSNPMTNYINSVKGGLNNVSSQTKSTQYMADNPFNSEDDLVSLLEEHTGVGDNVSVMFYDESNMLRIGGYTNSKDFNLKIGSEKFKTSYYEVKYREDTATSSPAKEYMWLSGPINPEISAGKEIHLSDSNGEIPSTTFRQGENGGVITTHRPMIKHTDYYLSYNTINGKQVATIEKGAGV